MNAVLEHRAMLDPVLGRLPPALLDAGGDLPAEAVMEPGPSTVRGDSHLEPLAELRRRRDLTSPSVTTPDGVLLGVVRRDDLEATLASGQP